MAEEHNENHQPITVKSETEDKRAILNNRLRFILYFFAIGLAAIFLYRMFRVLF